MNCYWLIYFYMMKAYTVSDWSDQNQCTEKNFLASVCFS